MEAVNTIDEIELIETIERPSTGTYWLVFRVLKSTEPMRAGLTFKVAMRGINAPHERAWEAAKSAPVLRCIWRTATNGSRGRVEWPEFFAALEPAARVQWPPRRAT